jgi:2-keto-4-pentenoate hydratase/2-oxohepta-3-ene-1,7-dioic acid hydratase in catechol pathway
MLIYNIPEIIEDFSKGITLEPGDIIITGTPAGVGMGFKPPKYLKAGDTVECEIKEIGKLITVIK